MVCVMLSICKNIFLDLNEEEDIRMYDTKEEHWRDNAEDGGNNKKIHDLKWEFYAKEKEGLIYREFFGVCSAFKRGDNLLSLCEG